MSGQGRLDDARAGTATALEARRVSQTVLALVLDLQSSQRGFVLTANQAYLEP